MKESQGDLYSEKKKKTTENKGNLSMREIVFPEKSIPIDYTIPNGHP